MVVAMVLAGLVGCSGGGGGIDAATDGVAVVDAVAVDAVAADAVVADASELDASAVDASVDAAIDAAVVDAATDAPVDAVLVDAPVDAMLVDAPIDAVVVDAPIDAAPPSALGTLCASSFPYCPSGFVCIRSVCTRACLGSGDARCRLGYGGPGTPTCYHSPDPPSTPLPPEAFCFIRCAGDGDCPAPLRCTDSIPTGAVCGI